MKKTILTIAAVLLSISAFAVMEIVVNPETENYVYDYKMTQSDIKASKPVSIAGILSKITDINIASKGFAGVLSDVSINGGSFEQTAILLNGLKINDLQTGHFNLDIPVPAISIGSITVVKNANSSIGSGGFTGLINIETLKYDRDTYKAHAEYGTYNTQYYGLSYIRKVSAMVIDLSVERSSSDGYHFDTDYYKNTALLNLEFDNSYGMSLGYGEKAYGAYDFYTPLKNNASWEYLGSKFIGFTALKNQPLSFSAYYRSHYDCFVLKRENPSYYTNKHNTSFYGADAAYEWKVNEGNVLRAKYNFQREEIQSKRLGNHYRNKHEALLNGYFTMLDSITANLNAVFDKYDIYSSYDFMPSVSVVMKITPFFKINAGYSTSVRYPNFTELYYNDPFNQGNPNLKSEKCGEYSGGADIETQQFKFGVSAFYRQSSDLIDWGKDNISDAVWQIKNIGRVNTAGFTVNTGVKLDFAALSLSYTYLDSYRSENFISKYGLTYLRNKANASVDFELLTVKVKADYTYKNYINRPEAFHGLDITLSRKIVEGVEVALKSENTLNWYFEETVGVPAVGRIISGRLELEF